MASLRIAGQTDVGRARRDNQDTFISQPLWSANDALLVVIDGVGGYAGGAQAAELARESIVQYMAAPTGDTFTMLREAVIFANNQIARQRHQDPSLGRMCCVLTAAVADTETGKLLYVHVGDTRLYRLRQHELEKLTHDHSLVGVREDANQLTEREAMRHPRRNEILREVGSVMHRVDDPDFLESGESDFGPGDTLLLCSDGLTDMLTRAAITSVMTQPISLEAQLTELIRQANEQGGQDNITIVLAQQMPVDTAANVPVLPTPQPARIRNPLPNPIQPATGQPISATTPRTRKWVVLVVGTLGVLALILAIALGLPTRTDQPINPAKPIPIDTITAVKPSKPVNLSASTTRSQPDSTR